MRPGDRSLFPDLTWPVYLNHAAVGPLARSTVEAVHQATTLQASRGLDAIGSWLDTLQLARERAATLLGVRADDVSLQHNTGDGVQAIAHGVDWREGDRIILLRGEFPTNVLPWLYAARAHGLVVEWLDADAFSGPSGTGLQQLAELCRRPVRLLACSAVQFQTGLRMPLQAIADLVHGADGLLFVDAIQAVGAVPFQGDVADFVACGGHKWLMAPTGTGLLWARPEHWSCLQPATAGWLSVQDPIDFLDGTPGRLRYDKPFTAGPALLEGSNRNHAGLCGLAEALRLANEVHPFMHIQALHDRIEPALLERGFTSARSAVPEQRSGILSVRPPGGQSVGELAHRLADRGICAGTPDGWLRISPSWPNPQGDAEALIGAIGRAIHPSA